MSPLGKSDHCVITFTYNITFESCSYKVKRTFYDKGDYAGIKKQLGSIKWDTLLSGKSVQSQWDVLTTIIKELEEQYIPSKIVDVNGDDRFGEKLPNHIRMQIKKKHNLWKRYMETKKAEIHNEFCRTRNKVKNKTKYFRKQKEEKISSNIKENPKAFWRYTKAKTLTKNHITSLIQKIKIAI